MKQNPTTLVVGVCQHKSCQLPYDQNGNLTSDGNFNYYYDSENRLNKVTKVSDGSTVVPYKYDYRGLRISKTTASGTIRYHWDNNERLIRDSDVNGNTLALYIYNDQDQLLSYPII